MHACNIVSCHNCSCRKAYYAPDKTMQVGTPFDLLIKLLIN